MYYINLTIDSLLVTSMTCKQMPEFGHYLVVLVGCGWWSGNGVGNAGWGMEGMGGILVKDLILVIKKYGSKMYIKKSNIRQYYHNNSNKNLLNLLYIRTVIVDKE